MKIWFAALAVIAVLVVGAPTLLQAAHNDRVHYVTHLVAGQVLSLCPCTAGLAQTQRTKGLYHAHTQRQVDLLLDRPSQLVGRAVRRVVA